MALITQRFVAVALGVGVAACSAAISPVHRQDAQTAVRVKTALVNDADLGVLPIEVRVADGVVTLSGEVRTQAQADRAVTLARGLPGVTRVVSDLHIGGAQPMPAAAPAPRPTAVAAADADLRAPNQHRVFAVGANIAWSVPPEGRLAARTTIGPLFRVGSGDGMGATVGFGWYSMDLLSGLTPGLRLARLRIRPVMGGFALRHSGTRVSTSIGVLAGVAFNSLQPQFPIQVREVPVSISSSPAVRLSSSMWFDLNARLALGLSAGYVVTRPRLTSIEDDVVTRRVLRGDALLIETGMVYKLF